LHIFELLFDCLISYLYMRVLKLSLGKNYFSPNFSLFFSFSVWSVRTDLAYNLNARGLANCKSGCGSSGRVGTTSERDPYRYFFAAYFLNQLHTTAFLLIYHDMLCVSLTVFSRDFGILCTSLLIPWYSLSSFVLLSFCTF
jgi:hypothetical protein